MLSVLTCAATLSITPIAAADGLVAPPGVYAGSDGGYPAAANDWPPDPALLSGAGGSGAGGSGGPSRLPRNATYMDQSAYAMGTMTWNVIMLESNGGIDANQEDWTADEITTIQSEINQAKTFWEGLTAGFHPGARLSIDVHYENGGVPMATPYEPITRSSTQDYLWINSAMNALGYNFTGPNGRFNNVRNYNNARRNADGKLWATTIFIVDDTIDPDNRFSDSSFAYAYFNGPYAVLTQGNNGWGINNFSMVLSHEMGHIFGALDEYQASNVRNTYTAGYLNGATLNASLDGNGNVVAPPQPKALMLNNGDHAVTGATYLPHWSAADNFGLRDSDGDTIPDILDTPAMLTGGDIGSDPVLGNFVFSGDISVNDYPNANPLNAGFSNSQARMTINTITSMAYSLDGGFPTPFPSLDAAYDDYEESLGFSIFGLPMGVHTIDVVGIDSVGNSSNVLHFEFNSQLVPEPGTALLAFISLIGTMNIHRGRSFRYNGNRRTVLTQSSACVALAINSRSRTH